MGWFKKINVAKRARVFLSELIVVIIGILISYLLYNWNEGNIDRDTELKVLQNLKQDFEESEKRLIKLMAQNDHNIKNNKITMSYLGLRTEDLTFDMIERVNLGHFIFERYEFVGGSLNALLNSNQLELISNNELKKLLTELPSEVQIFKDERERINDLYISQHRPKLESYINQLYEAFYFNKNSIICPNLKVDSVKADFTGLLVDHEYHNLIIKESVLYSHNNERATKVLSKLRNVIRIIDKELEDS